MAASVPGTPVSVTVDTNAGETPLYTALQARLGVRGWVGSSPRWVRSDVFSRFASDPSCDPSRSAVRRSQGCGLKWYSERDAVAIPLQADRESAKAFEQERGCKTTRLQQRRQAGG